MKRIRVDFNARNEDDRVRLSTRGAIDSIITAGGVTVGERIVVTDGDEAFQAEVQQKNGELVASVDWTT